MTTEEGLLIAAIIVLTVLLTLCIIIFWYRSRAFSKKTDGKQLYKQLVPVANLKELSSEPLTDVFVAALSSIQDGILILRENQQVEFVNSAAEHIFELKPEKIKGATFIEVVRDYEFDALFRKSISTGRQQNSLIRSRRSEQLFSVTIIPVQNSSRYVVIVTDMTERQRMEDIRRDLISNISHEFRTPISSIRLLSETLIDGAIKDHKVAEDFLKKIYIETMKLNEMTQELSVLSRVEGGESALDKGATDIQELIVRSVERLRTLAESNGVKVDIKVEPGLPSPVIDKDQIESVLINLIHNAIKFTIGRGRITVAAKEEKEGRILVSVSDTGIGIAQEEMPRIFERFYKVDKSRAGEGSGLGLAISKHIISAHGGRIWVDSVEGKGSTFYFTLPLASA